MEMRKKVVFKVALTSVLCALIFGILGTAFSSPQFNRTIPNDGSVKGIGVGIYWDSACTNQTVSIDWGMLDPGSNKTVAIYIRNEGNAAANLSNTVQNWNPSNAQNYLTLNWNYANQALSVNQVLQVSLTIIISPTAPGMNSLSFDLTITATG